MAEIVKQATMKNLAFWVCLSLSIALIVAGFCVPTHGEIDGSVLTACGILFAFATLETVHIAIKKGVDAKVKYKNTELSIGDLDKTQTKTNENEYEETE